MPRVTEAQIEAARRRTFESAASFNAAVRDFADSTGDVYLVPLHKKLHLQGLRLIVQKTPVDKGRARGEWQSTRESEPNEEIGFIRSPEEVLQEGLITMAGLSPYSVSYIANLLPYPEALEAGSSDQAPRGMVSLSVTELETQFR